MKKRFSTLFLGMVFVAMVPWGVGAQTNTDQLLSIIARLQETLTFLQGRLAEIGDNGSTVSCYSFNENLGRDARGLEVTTLQRALQNNGLYKGFLHGRYDEATTAAVSAFQTRYADEILAPAGLATSTGYVGRSTRQKLNKLFGCQGEQKEEIERPDLLYPFIRSAPRVNQPPIVSNVFGPTTLTVGQMGTWIVSATDTEKDRLTYYVIWGDETTLGTAGAMPSSPQVAYTPVATFTHRYTVAGTYTPRFLVKDATGGNSETSLVVSVLGQ